MLNEIDRVRRSTPSFWDLAKLGLALKLGLPILQFRPLSPQGFVPKTAGGFQERGKFRPLLRPGLPSSLAYLSNDL